MNRYLVREASGTRLLAESAERNLRDQIAKRRAFVRNLGPYLVVLSFYFVLLYLILK